MATSAATLIAARVGQAFHIDLPGNPATGHLWLAETERGPLELVERQTVPDVSHVGAPALQRFVFVPREPGDVALRFALKRPWEPMAREVRTFEVSARDD